MKKTRNIYQPFIFSLSLLLPLIPLSLSIRSPHFSLCHLFRSPKSTEEQRGRKERGIKREKETKKRSKVTTAAPADSRAEPPTASKLMQTKKKMKEIKRARLFHHLPPQKRDKTLLSVSLMRPSLVTYLIPRLLRRETREPPGSRYCARAASSPGTGRSPRRSVLGIPALKLCLVCRIYLMNPDP